MTLRARTVLATLAWCAFYGFMVVGAVLLAEKPLPPRGVPQARDFIAFQPGPAPAPVVLWSADRKTLTVTEHAPRDLLVCLRGDCRLVEEWLGK